MHTVAIPVQYNRRNRNFGLAEQPSFQVSQSWVSGCCSVTVSISVDHNFDKIRIVETRNGCIEQRVSEFPVRRPELPQQTTNLTPISFHPCLASFGVKVPVIPRLVF